MATSHGKKTVITVATKDISPYTKNSSLEKAGDVHDVTGYGPAGDARIHAGGLITSKFSMSGVYDNTVSVGPRLVFKDAVGTTLAVVRKLEGTGTTLPSDTFNAILEKYVETNPYDDMVTWSADMTVTGPIVTTAQP